MKEWLTIKEVAKLTGRHYLTVRSWVKKGLVISEQLEPNKKRSEIKIKSSSIKKSLFK